MVILFSALAALAVGSGIGVVAFRTPLYNALALVGNMLSLALLFLLLNAQFVAVVQVIVYAGAVVVLFVFIIALLSPGPDVAIARLGGVWWVGILFGVLFLLPIVVLLSTRGDLLTGKPGDATPEQVSALGSVQVTGRALYTTFLFPFEATSLILLVALVGAVYLGKRRLR
jgi:NADH-quinone oxidoreductase subunit J